MLASGDVVILPSRTVNCFSLSKVSPSLAVLPEFAAELPANLPYRASELIALPSMLPCPLPLLHFRAFDLQPELAECFGGQSGMSSFLPRRLLPSCRACEPAEHAALSI